MFGLPPVRILKDITEAQRASVPHLEAANALHQRVIALMIELEREGSAMNAEKRGVRQRELDELREQYRREQEAAREPMDELKARYPRWIT